MNSKKENYMQARWRSLGHATKGITTFFIGETHAKIHLAATVAVVVTGVVQHIPRTSWLAISFAIALVWITEAINTALEKLCDYACGKQYHETIKQIKDIAAGAVLMAAVCSVVVAILVFI